MKTIAKILALYFILVSFMPGHAMDASCCSTIETEICETSQEESNQDCCPPSCSCICCGISSAITIKTIIWENTISKPSSIINAYHYTSRKGILFQEAVWQPPRIS